MITQSDTEWSNLNGFQNSEHIMQHFHYITPMITLNELSLFGLVCTSVTNNWIAYRIKRLLWLRKPHEPTVSTPHDVDGLLKQKRVLGVYQTLSARALILQVISAPRRIVVWLC